MSYSKATAMTDDDLAPSPTRRVLVWSGIILLLVVCAAAIALTMSRPHPDPRLAFPRIHGAGGVLPVGPNALMPSATAEHRLYVDVDNDEPTRSNDINTRLHTAAKLLNLYALAGVPNDKVHLVVLFYGKGVDLALSDAAYEKKFGHPNPNANLIRQLRQANVQMVVCGQALGHQNFVASNIQPGMTLALSALTAREELQAAGYGPVPKEPD
jgi:intracellular sulfur oxidation DsrE/DsrF family protein